MGLILDSTVFIAPERRGLSARQALEQIATRFPEEQFALSAITLIELAHGVARADTLWPWIHRRWKTRPESETGLY